jgi:hypothetical protein
VSEKKIRKVRREVTGDAGAGNGTAPPDTGDGSESGPPGVDGDPTGVDSGDPTPDHRT